MIYPSKIVIFRINVNVYCRVSHGPMNDLADEHRCGRPIKPWKMMINDAGSW